MAIRLKKIIRIGKISMNCFNIPLSIKRHFLKKNLILLFFKDKTMVKKFNETGLCFPFLGKSLKKLDWRFRISARVPTSDIKNPKSKDPSV